MRIFKREPLPNRPYVNAVVILWNCNGCMAHDHQMQWVGRIAELGETLAWVEIDKRNGSPRLENTEREEFFIKQLEPTRIPGLFYIHQ